MDEQRFWTNVLRVVEVAPRDITSIRGFSGMSHTVLAGGVDEGRRRLVLISGDADPRVAAYIQSDVQAAMRDVSVVVARVSYFDQDKILDQIVRLQPAKNPDEFGQQMTVLLGPLIETYMANARVSQQGLNDIPPGLISDLMKTMVASLFARLLSVVEDPEAYPETMQKQLLSNARFSEVALGLCPFPVHCFSPEEMETLRTDSHTERAQELLREKGILQYFFPAPDQLALGLIDRGTFTVARLLESLEETSNLGHPLGAMEIAPDAQSLPEMIDALQEKGLVVEGEVSLEVTPQGNTLRQKVVFKPREGIISKVLNRFSVTLDLSKLMHPH